jgi:hypothetical protein
LIAQTAIVFVMRTVGSRQEAPLAALATGALLAEGARFNEALSAFGAGPGFPKGIYRYRTHEEANQHRDDCLVRAMVQLATSRQSSNR